MILHEQRQMMRLQRRRGRIAAVFVSITCFLRGLPLFFSKTPKTPLRVLCLIAFDTLYGLRNSKPMPRHKLRVLAVLLDFGACVNAALDSKRYCAKEYNTTRQRLQEAGLGLSIHEYITQLRKLERQRPVPGGDHQRFEEIRKYREAVARLSLGIIAATALGDEGSENGSHLMYDDHELETLFQIVMQCQIIDDVLDYSKDAPAGLPGFLTATASLPQAIELTSLTSRTYATGRDVPESTELFPFRTALFGVSALARLIIRIRFWRCCIGWSRGLPDESLFDLRDHSKASR